VRSIIRGQNQFMNMRRLILGSALILMASGAFAGGTYQETKRGRITVWNEHPAAGELAKWSGRRDKNGYATGDGTLTWYRLEAPNRTGSRIPFTRTVILSRYSGKMVRGKLEGSVVSTDSDGRRTRVAFVNGHESTEKVAKTSEPSPVEVAAQPAEEKVPRAELVEPAAPAAGPDAPPVAKPLVEPPIVEQAPAKPEAVEKQSSPTAVGRTSAKAQAEAEESLSSLVGPPNSLRAYPIVEPSPKPSVASIAPTPAPPAPPPPRPDLIAAEAIELADGEARTHGYNLGEYQAPKAHYDADEDAWTVSYVQKGADRASADSKHFGVSVGDKTKRTSIVDEK
jgi:hypothetical protein